MISENKNVPFFGMRLLSGGVLINLHFSEVNVPFKPSSNRLIILVWRSLKLAPLLWCWKNLAFSTTVSNIREVLSMECSRQSKNQLFQSVMSMRGEDVVSSNA